MVENLAMSEEKEDLGQFSNDAPVSDPKLDAFYRHPFALRIAEMIKARSDSGSAVIAVYGEWGEGKTTVLEFVRNELRASEDVILIPFNPWRFGSDEQLLWAFFASLSHALKAPLKTKFENIASWFAEYGEVVIPKIELAYGAASASAGENVSKLADRFAHVDPETARERIEEALGKAKKRIVILMDDIDRLDSDEIHQVFKLIKLTANFPFVDYLLAFDDDVVAKALGKRYCEDAAMGRSFLEKIVQVPLPLPPASETSLRNFCFGAIDRVLNDSKIQLSSEEASSFAGEFSTALSPFLNTPRMASRFANAIRFGLPTIKGEVNAVDFMLLEGTRLFLPAVYEIIRQEGANVLHAHDLSKDETILPRINESLEKLSSREKSAAIDLLRFLLPQLQAVIGVHGLFGLTGYSDGSYEMWAKNRRLCIKDYFARYFSLGVAPDDLSEAAISQLIVEASSGAEAVEKWLDANVTPKKAEALVRKLYYRAEDVDEAAAEAICVGLARRGKLFSDKGGMMTLSPSLSIARYFWETIKTRVGKKNRKRVSLRVLQEATPVHLAWDCVWLFRPSEKEKDPGLISEANTRKVLKEIAERALTEFETVVPWEVSPDSFMSSLWQIANAFGRRRTESLLSGIFEKQPKAVLDLLMHSTGKAYPFHTGIAHAQDFESRHLENLDKVFSKRKLFALVKKQAGHLPKIKDRYSTLGLKGREKTAAQFIFVYENYKPETASAEGFVSGEDES